MSDAVIIAIIGLCSSLLVAIIPKIIDQKSGLGKDVKDIKEDIGTLKENDRKNGDMIYQMLDHLATNNNTGGMKKALDQYNEYFRHS